MRNAHRLTLSVNESQRNQHVRRSIINDCQYLVSRHTLGWTNIFMNRVWMTVPNDTMPVSSTAHTTQGNLRTLARNISFLECFAGTSSIANYLSDDKSSSSITNLDSEINSSLKHTQIFSQFYSIVLAFYTLHTAIINTVYDATYRERSISVGLEWTRQNSHQAIGCYSTHFRLGGSTFSHYNLACESKSEIWSSVNWVRHWKGEVPGATVVVERELHPLRHSTDRMEITQ